MRTAVFLAAVLSAAAQDPQQQQDAPPKASISGAVLDIATGKPLPNYNVSTYVDANWQGDALMNGSQARNVDVVTDDQGRYRLSDLPPATYRITARSAVSGAGFAGAVTRHIAIAGRDLDHIDFKVRVPGLITGKVVDENREPVVGATVYLVSREYYSGVLGYFFKDLARTDDRGLYRLKRVEAGHPYLVMVDTPELRLAAYSNAPLDPKLRRRGLVRTFYPNSPEREGGSIVTVNPGETREGVDIEARKAPTFCVDGTLMSLGGPAALYFFYEAAQPAFGTSSGGGMYGLIPNGRTGPDGKYRICGLVPGSYRLSAADSFQGASIQRALAPFEISDRDLHHLDLSVSPGITVPGEVVWDAAGPDTPAEAKLTISVAPLRRGPVANERPGARSDVPGNFTLTGLLPSEYGGVRVFLNLPGAYVKDVTYSGKSVRYAPISVGGAAGDLGMRVVVARDAGRIAASVADKDGNPLSDYRVAVLPAEVSSEAMAQAAMISGQTDQQGRYKSQAIAPGKYLVLATDDLIDPTPECIDNLWRSRARFQEVELPPGGNVQVSLTPVPLRR